MGHTHMFLAKDWIRHSDWFSITCRLEIEELHNFVLKRHTNAHQITKPNMFQLDEREMSTYSPEEQQKNSQKQFLKHIVIFGLIIAGLRVAKNVLANQ